MSFWDGVFELSITFVLILEILESDSGRVPVCSQCQFGSRKRNTLSTFAVEHGKNLEYISIGHN